MNIDDKELIEKLQVNPEKGFRMLMTKYQEAVYWHIRRLVVSHAIIRATVSLAIIRATISE